jgi:HEPN domain-containing protein
MKSPAQVREETVREWLDSAATDLEWAELGAKNSGLKGFAPIGFHAQQAIEKLLKGLLAAYDVVPEEDHSIARLLAQARRVDRSTADAISGVASLTRHAVVYRYPPRNPAVPHALTRADVLHDLETARDAYEVLRTAVEQRLTRLRDDGASSPSD